MEQKHRIIAFIIEDNKMFSILIKSELTKLFNGKDFLIFAFENGESCEQSLSVKPDIVLVDYHLDAHNPNAMDGLGVINMIKGSYPDTDIIMITHNEETELFLKSKKMGIYDYLTKSSHLPYKLGLTINQWLKLKGHKIPL